MFQKTFYSYKGARGQNKKVQVFCNDNDTVAAVIMGLEKTKHV